MSFSSYKQFKLKKHILQWKPMELGGVPQKIDE